MDYEIVTDQAASLEAFHTLRTTFSIGAQYFKQHELGWQSQHGQFDLYWHARLGIWGVFEPQPPVSSGRRFWILFGTSNPSEQAMLPITVEINPPHEGIDARVGGAFLRDEKGRTFIAHNGRVGGGRKGIGQSAFMDFLRSRDYQGNWQLIIQPGGRTRIVNIISAIDAKDLAQSTALYVHEVAKFKEFVTRT